MDAGLLWEVVLVVCGGRRCWGVWWKVGAGVCVVEGGGRRCWGVWWKVVGGGCRVVCGERYSM